MRRWTISIMAALILTVASLGSALGHVHGITPLGCVTTDNPMAGANGTNGTPADDDNGGPIAGLIPRDLGNAPVGPGFGGKHSALCP